MLPQDSEYNEWASIEAMVHMVAYKVHSRVVAAGLGPRIALDDLVQEGAITWIKAKAQFDPSKGAKFTTYLHNALWHNLNRYVNRQNHRFRSVSMDDEAVFTQLAGGEEPDKQWAAENAVQGKLKKLSPRGRLVLEWLISPPDWLVEEQQAMIEMGKEQVAAGYTQRAAVSQDLSLIMTVLEKVWGVNRQECQRLAREVRGVSK